MRYLYVGPTLPDAARVAGADVTVLPPVAAGDLLRLAPRAGDVVGIVDGYFHQTRAVRHKEIMHLLDVGVTVLGAASLGALRAAELDRFGMRGVGTIYEDYRDGRLVADDEVTLLHGPAESGYQGASEPLVNIRATLASAEAEGVISAEVGAETVRVLAASPYPARTYHAVVAAARAAGLPPAAAASLERLCRTRPVNRKRADALLLVSQLTTSPPRPAGAFPLARTVHLDSWQQLAQGTRTAEGWVGDQAALRVCQLFAQDYPAFHRDLVFGWLADECARGCVGDASAVVSQEPTQATLLAHAVHRGVLPQPADWAAALGHLTAWFTPAESRELPVPDRLALLLVRSFRLAPARSADPVATERLRGTPAWQAAQRLVLAARAVNEQTTARQPGFDVHQLSRERILDYFTERWNAAPDDLELHAADRGFTTLDHLVAAARPCYLLGRYNPELTGLRIGTSRPS